MRRTLVRQVGPILAAAALTGCDSGTHDRSPTAPSPIPQPPAVTYYSGSITLLGAAPGGDCVADAVSRSPGGPTAFLLGLPESLGDWTGSYSGDLLGGCAPVRVTAVGSDSVELQIYPYCNELLYSEWPYSRSCAPADAYLIPVRMRLPAPAAGAGGVLSGQGTITLARFPDELGEIDLQVAFDLRP